MEVWEPCGSELMLAEAERYGQTGFDHGVGHPLRLLCHAKAPHY